jgi:WD40 repeat protein
VPKPPEIRSSLASGRFTDHVTMPAWSPDGTRFVAGDLAGNLCVFEQQNGTYVPRVVLHDPPAKAYAGPQVYGVSWPAPEHIVSVERGQTRQRRPSDLAETGIASRTWGQRVESGGNGAWVVVQGDNSAQVLDVPGLAMRCYLSTGHHDYSGPRTTAFAGDPRGTLFAACGDGGSEETAMAMITAQGRPTIDIVDVATEKTVARIPELTHVLAFDHWREQLLVGTYPDTVSCYSFDGQLVRSFKAHDGGVRSVAATERWIITASNKDSSIALWGADSLEKVVSVEQAPYTAADWIVPSPDGLRFLTQARPADRTYPLRVWQIDP